MAKKSPLEKLETKVKSILLNNADLKQVGKKIKYENHVLFSYTKTSLVYTKKRYYSNSIVKVSTVDFTTTIILDNNTIELISRTSIKPSSFIPYLRNLFKGATTIDFDSVEIGSAQNKIEGTSLKITYSLYNTLEKIHKEEKRDEAVRFKTRAANFFQNEFGISLNVGDVKIDWVSRLQEILVSGNFNQQDIQKLTEKLEPGESTKISIEKQVNKQVNWLLEKIEEILDKEGLNKTSARKLGSDVFNYSQTEISGPEHLMEKILTDYGQHTLFGVPALINTNKYVISKLPRVQFDLLLITNLGDIEVVELKKPDTILLDFDPSRNKFYASSELSIAIAQTERYISSIIKDNDDDLKIDGKKIRDYINDELGNSFHVESVRPSGLIIVGSSKTIAIEYDKLSETIKNKIPRDNYNENCERAYRELRDSHKNIKIVTYSDLVESARLRLQLTKTDNN